MCNDQSSASSNGRTSSGVLQHRLAHFASRLVSGLLFPGGGPAVSDAPASAQTVMPNRILLTLVSLVIV
jgi:hypothetical protein